MWDRLNKIPPILVGQCILTCLDLKSIVRLETALARSELTQILRSFLSYYTKADIKVHIPEEVNKLKWLQNHDFPITKTIIQFDKINETLNTNMINEIELVDNCVIPTIALNFLPHHSYEKVVSICFKHIQDADLMEELFSRLHNLRELSVSCPPDGWILSALRGLHRGSNHNVVIEKITIVIIDFYVRESSVAEIAEYCPKLQSLSVSFGITVNSLLALSTHCTLLKELKIPRMPRISTEQTTTLCAPTLSCINAIAVPNILSYHDIPNYARIIPYLTELKRVCGGGSKDHVLLPLISQYCLKLEIVFLLASSSATSTQLLQLAQNCRHLHAITIYNEMLITDEIIIELIRHCPMLQRLSLGYRTENTAVTDASLLALCEHCSSLQELSISMCTQITEGVVLQLIQKCKQLRRLALPYNIMSEDTVLEFPVKIVKQRLDVIYTLDRRL